MNALGVLLTRFFIPGVPKAWARAGVLTKVKTQTGYKHLDFPVHFDRTDKAWKTQVASKLDTDSPDIIFAGPLVLSLEFYLPRPRGKPKRIIYPDVRPDADNLAKVIKDLMKGTVYKDDAQIIDLHVYKRYATITGVKITISRPQTEDLRNAS